MKAKKSAIKRMIAICLTAVMTLAMATTAFAEEAKAVAPMSGTGERKSDGTCE